MKFIIVLFSILNCSPIEKKDPLSIQNPKFDIGPIELDPIRKDRGLYAEHYPASNERRIDLFWNTIDSLGGAYLGVGTDQNLSFAARAKSEWIFLVDFDPEIVKVNRLHIFFLKNSQTYSEFKHFWMRKNKESTLKYLKEKSGNELNDLEVGLNIGLKPGIGVPERLQELEYMEKNFLLKTFSNKDEDYQFLRKRALENKIIAINGDLTGSLTLKDISKRVSQAGLTINVFYTSNAEEYFKFPTNYRENIKSMPISEESVLIRTITAGSKSMGYPDGEKYPDSFPFHYNYQKIGNLKKWMDYPKEFNIPFLLKYRTNIQKGFSKIEQDPPI